MLHEPFRLFTGQGTHKAGNARVLTAPRLRWRWRSPDSPPRSSSQDTASPNAPPMGLRLRLKASYGLGGGSRRGWDDGNLDQLKRIPGRAFEVVRCAAPVHAC